MRNTSARTKEVYDSRDVDQHGSDGETRNVTQWLKNNSQSK